MLDFTDLGRLSLRESIFRYTDISAQGILQTIADIYLCIFVNDNTSIIFT